MGGLTYEEKYNYHESRSCPVFVSMSRREKHGDVRARMNQGQVLYSVIEEHGAPPERALHLLSCHDPYMRIFPSCCRILASFFFSVLFSAATIAYVLCRSEENNGQVDTVFFFSFIARSSVVVVVVVVLQQCPTVDFVKRCSIFWPVLLIGSRSVGSFWRSRGEVRGME